MELKKIFIKESLLKTAKPLQEIENIILNN